MKLQRSPITGKLLRNPSGKLQGECCCTLNHIFYACSQCVNTTANVIISDEYFTELFPDDPNDPEHPTALYVKSGYFCFGAHARTYAEVNTTSGLSDGAAGSCVDCIADDPDYFYVNGMSIGCTWMPTAYNVTFSFPSCASLNGTYKFWMDGTATRTYAGTISYGATVGTGLTNYWSITSATGHWHFTPGNGQTPQDFATGAGCYPENGTPCAVTVVCPASSSWVNGTMTMSRCET